MAPSAAAPSRFARIGRSLGLKHDHHISSTEKIRAEHEKKLAKQRGKLQKKGIVPLSHSSRQDDVNELGERSYSVFSTRSGYSDASTLVDKPKDHTDLMHGLAHHDSFDSLVEGTHVEMPGLDSRFRVRSEKHERLIKSLPSDVWKSIAAFLEPADAAHLAIASKTLKEKLGDEPLKALQRPEMQREKIRFLRHLDQYLPDHLLCFSCGLYHRRTHNGSETLKIDFVNNPVFACPAVYSSYLPRMRITYGRELPYSFIQLTTRHVTHSRHHGIHTDKISRRWRDPTTGWQHSTRFLVHDGRLLMRVRSQVFAPPKLTPTAERNLLYDREEYIPYFSVCAHWRDGELMNIAKCALSHIPEPPQSYVSQLSKQPTLSRSLANPGYIVRMCDDCRPARRCPECPTEYLIEVNMVEDKFDRVNRFKHALVVTRWSDLGNGSSPTASPEYCAVNGAKADYDSFSHVGRRAVAGIFESKMSGAIPGQRMISLNPNNTKLGEDGHGWY
jgi:hypothetical protein